MDWSELQERVEFVRGLYRRLKVPLKVGQGLANSLDEAEALANGEKLCGDPSHEQLRAIAHDAHVIWALADSLKICDDQGLDLRAHLAHITTGSTDYGQPADGHSKEIFYKDFECELLIAAALTRNGVAAKFSDKPNDPRGDLVAGPIRVEVKHPNSTGQLKKLIRKFNGKLREEDSYGVFVVGVEDMFFLADQQSVASPTQFESWLEFKRDQMKAFGIEFLREASRRERILVLAQTQTIVEFYEEATRLRRLGNSCIFDQRKNVPEDSMSVATKVASTFNPNPPRFSQLGLG